jgi:hypothetical protein
MVPTGDEDVPATVRTGEEQDPVLDATGHGRC